MQKKITITETGQTDDIQIGADEILSFGLIGDESDYVANVEVKLTDDGNWFTAQSSCVDGVIYTTTAGARLLRVDVTNMGAASSIDFEITGQNI